MVRWHSIQNVRKTLYSSTAVKIISISNKIKIIFEQILEVLFKYQSAFQHHFTFTLTLIHKDILKLALQQVLNSIEKNTLNRPNAMQATFFNSLVLFWDTPFFSVKYYHTSWKLYFLWVKRDWAERINCSQQAAYFSHAGTGNLRPLQELLILLTAELSLQHQ